MKITANPSGAAPRPASPARPVAPIGTSRFAALLAGDPSRDAAGQRALGFGELGVFARAAAPGGEADAASPEGHAAKPHVEATDTNADLAAPETMASIASPAPWTQRLRACADAIRVCLDQASEFQDPGPGAAIALPSPTPASVLIGGKTGPDEGPAPGIPRARIARPAPSQVSLVLAEDGQGLKVLAAGFQISPALGERLRQRIADLAAEHGLTLSDLLVDGQPLDAPSFHFQGAIHGDYAR